ncbi:hypothetical protein HFP72_16855 [Nocardiopsis sp. ARC36]
MPTPTGKSTRAERSAQPLAREVAEQVAAEPVVEPTPPRNAWATRAAASLAIAAGADVKVVQAVLGHATATMALDRYGHLFPTAWTRWPTRWTRPV